MLLQNVGTALIANKFITYSTRARGTSYNNGTDIAGFLRLCGSSQMNFFHRFQIL